MLLIGSPRRKSPKTQRNNNSGRDDTLDEFARNNAQGGGVTVSLAQDIHGKSYSNVMLAIELPDPK